jgi:hypothetical protein
VVWLFALTLFVSALLLFLVQPLIARMLLPLLGGTPAVWQTCLFFFQGALLAGYGYAHFTGKWLAPRRQALLHLVVLSVAAFTFPLAVSETLLPAIDKQTSPMLWLLGCLTITVGLPFFAVSTSGPLLQWWFSRTQHALAGNPYFLYAASNLGSLAALLGYPLLVEPNLRLSNQTRLWSFGYGILALLVSACALVLWKSAPGNQQEQVSAEPAIKTAPIKWTRRLRWIALAFAPTSLMYGVTTYLTTDLAAVPLLWVLPLALYLLSFILVFARRRVVSLSLMNALLALLAVVLTFLMLTKLPRPLWLLGGLHLLFLFVAATVCHGRLAGDRPPARHLTEFYLWMSLAGALGGLFNSLLAPLLFRTVLEYPLAIVLALLLRPAKRVGQASACPDKHDTQKSAPGFLLADLLWPLGIGSLTAGLAILLPRSGLPTMPSVVMTLALPLLLSYAWARRPVRFGLAIGAVVLGSFFFQDLFYGRTLHVERNFFGVLRVTRDQTGTFHQIFHGNTNHGRQFIEPRRQCEPLSYYHRHGPLGQIFEAFNAHVSFAQVAAIGLGAGAAVCYASAGQQWTVYEIDPAVIRLARDNRYFTYLQNCAAAPVQMVLGDARLQLRQAADGQYGLIVLDAFSSDAIPTHLLTREAFALYLSKLADGGWLALHASNQYLDLRPVLADLVTDANLAGLVRDDLDASADQRDLGKDSSRWILIARRLEDLSTLQTDSRWQPLARRPRSEVWTDDYSNPLGVFKWR